MSKNNYAAVGFLILALVLWGLSLALPVWECGRGGTQLNGMFVLSMGYMGLFSLTPLWFCNLIFIYSAICVFDKKHTPRTTIALIFAAVGSTALIGPYFCGAPGSLDKGTGIASGGVIWVIALWAAFAAISLSKRKL